MSYQPVTDFKEAVLAHRIAMGHGAFTIDERGFDGKVLTAKCPDCAECVQIRLDLLRVTLTGSPHQFTDADAARFSDSARTTWGRRQLLDAINATADPIVERMAAEAEERAREEAWKRKRAATPTIWARLRLKEA